MIRFCLLAFALAACLGPALAQQPAPATASTAATYNVEISLRDASDPGAAAQPRHYTLLIAPGARGSLRINHRYAYPLPASAARPAQQPPQFQFMDLGVNLECSLQENTSSGKRTLRVELGLTTRQQAGTAPNAQAPPPSPASTVIHVESPVAPGARTLLASIDDAPNQRQLQVEARVTRVQ